MNDLISWQQVFSWENVAVTLLLAAVIYVALFTADRLLVQRGKARDAAEEAIFFDDKSVSAFVNEAADASSGKKLMEKLMPITRLPDEYDNAGDVKAVSSTERKVLKSALAKLREADSGKNVAVTESHPEVLKAAREQDENAVINVTGNVQAAIFTTIDSVRELRGGQKSTVRS